MTHAVKPHTNVDVPIATQSLDLTGVILEVNASWEQLSGYSAAEMVGHNYLDLVPEDHIEDFRGNLERLARDGELVGQDCFLRRKDGSIRDVQIFGRVDASTMRTNCVLVDITGFRRTERELAESEQRFRSLFALAPTPIMVHNGMSVVMANQACAHFLGYDTPDEVLGVTLADLVWPEDRELFGERVRRLMTEDWVAPPQEERFLRRDGAMACGETVSAPVMLDGQRAVYVIALDLTERQGAEQALEESEGRFRSLFEFSGDPIVVHDGRVSIFANQAALEAFGLPPESSTRGVAITDFILPDSLQVASERIAALLAGQSAEEPHVFHLSRSDGSDWYAEAKSAPIQLGGRRVVQTTFRDLTERHRHELELEQYRLQLEDLVAERTQSLERVRQELGAVTAVVSRTVEMRDPYTAGHQRRVAALAVAIARHLEMDDARVEELEVAAHLHDVGKVGVPAELLSKPAILSSLEDELVRTHVDSGYEIVLSASFGGDVAEIVRQHHERIDGSGYPRGLQGEEILDSAKVLMVADVVEAMSSHRPYRPSLGRQAAVDEIVAGRGGVFDPAVVDACVAVLIGGFDFEDPAF